MNKTIRIGTRKSALAMVQTELVAEALKQVQPGLETRIVTKVTEGDRILNKPLLEFGGKGVFVTEFEQALQNGEIDFAVHSAKDLPMDLEDGLGIVAVPPREDPRDVLMTPAGPDLSVKKEIVIGTSSLRRRLQIETLGKKLWPGAAVRCEDIRGNIQTRIRKMDEGLYDAIILAAAGLKRMKLANPAENGLEEYFETNGMYDFHYFDCETFIPAGGQGILAVEGRIEDRICEMAVRIQDEDAKTCLMLERKILKLLDAGCHEPVGVYSRIRGEEIEVFGISRRDRETKRVYLTGGIGELDLLAERAAKGLR